MATKRLHTPLSLFSLPRTTTLSSNVAMTNTARIPTARYMLINVMTVLRLGSLDAAVDAFAAAEEGQSFAPHKLRSTVALLAEDEDANT